MGYHYGITNLKPHLQGFAGDTVTQAFIDDDGGEKLMETKAGRKCLGYWCIENTLKGKRHEKYTNTTG